MLQYYYYYSYYYYYNYYRKDTTYSFISFLRLLYRHAKLVHKDMLTWVQLGRLDRLESRTPDLHVINKALEPYEPSSHVSGEVILGTR